MKKIAVLISGCGHRDGAEITETVSTLIALSELKVDVQCFSLNESKPSINHTNGQKEEDRHLLDESNRITRGRTQPLSELKAHSFDGLIIPGGMGAARWYSDWSEKKVKAKVHPEVQQVIETFYQGSRPMGGICIAPTLFALCLPHREITITLGPQSSVHKEIEKLGIILEDCASDDYITDRAHKIVTTPAYMDDKALPHQIFKGISGLVKEVVEMA